MDTILGFGCGLAMYHLIQFLQSRQRDKFNAGDEYECKECCYKKAVMDSLSVIGSDNDDNKK